MMIETQYQDRNGSVCPLCGARPHTTGRERLETYQLREPEAHVEITYYHAMCENDHYFQVLSEYNEDDDGINYLTRAFVDAQDWDDHNNVTTFLGPEQIPHLLTEDVIWQQHLRKLEVERERLQVELKARKRTKRTSRKALYRKN